MPLPLLLLPLLTWPMLTAAAAAVGSVNVTVDNVVVHLVDSGEELGEKFYLDTRSPLVMTCRANVPTGGHLVLSPGSIDWRRPGSNESISSVEPRAGFYTECATDSLSCVSTLRIRNPANSDVTSYACLATPRATSGVVASGAAPATVTSTGTFQSRPLLTLRVENTDKYDLAVSATDTVEVTCLVEGIPIGDIRWRKERHAEFNLTGNTTLRLTDLIYDRDRGDITCLSENLFGSNQATMFLRVKSPTAYVTPLVIIGVELLVLLVIIVAYEIHMGRRRRREAAEAEAKTD